MSAEEKKSITLSDEEGLSVAAKLMNTGQVEEAGKIYSLLMQSRKPEIRNEATFMLSQVYVLQQNYNKAIELLIGMLNRFPDLARVRLELARAYFLNENFNDARFHFELVKGGRDIPPAVIENVERYLAAIRQKKEWSLDLALGFVPDSNINQTSGNREECIESLFGLLCRPLEDKQSGYGVKLNATGNYYWKLSENFGIKNTAGIYLTSYEQSEYNDYILYVASGPRFVYGDSEISLQPTYTKRLYGGAQYSESYGLRLDLQNSYDRLILASGASLNRHTYDDDYIHSLLKGTEYKLYIQPRLILSSQSFVQAGLEYTRDETHVDMYGSDRIRYSAGFYYFFKYGISAFLEAGLTDAEYHAEQNFITKNHRIDRTRREDKLYDFSVELGTNIWEGQGIRPALRYTYTKRDSNIWTNDYDRNRIDMLLTFRF